MENWNLCALLLEIKMVHPLWKTVWQSLKKCIYLATLRGLLDLSSPNLGPSSESAKS